jgi:hypothetical protein
LVPYSSPISLLCFIFFFLFFNFHCLLVTKMDIELIVEVDSALGSLDRRQYCRRFRVTCMLPPKFRHYHPPSIRYIDPRWTSKLDHSWRVKLGSK